MTCWFNDVNEGRAGYQGQRPRGTPQHCTIRGLEIVNAAYTYCGNHPHRRPNKDHTPIGPVFTGDSSGQRDIWVDSPDTEEVRLHLLELLAEMQETPSVEYPGGWPSDELVAWQLGEFREARALRDLERVLEFSPFIEVGPFRRHRRGIITLAR
jgi:hypothetical protein